MKLVDRSYIDSNKAEILQAIRAGAIFIYPTDTIYGLGCNAENVASVQKVRDIKKRDQKLFSVIVPGKEWILENCIVPDPTRLDILPGPYTFILKWKNREGTIGVRIPDHWFSGVVAEAGVTFITTSVNLSGEKHMECLEDVPKDMLDQVDYVVYEGERKGVPSEKIDLVSTK